MARILSVLVQRFCSRGHVDCKFGNQCTAEEQWCTAKLCMEMSASPKSSTYMVGGLQKIMLSFHHVKLDLMPSIHRSLLDLRMQA